MRKWLPVWYFWSTMMHINILSIVRILTVHLSEASHAFCYLSMAVSSTFPSFLLWRSCEGLCLMGLGQTHSYQATHPWLIWWQDAALSWVSVVPLKSDGFLWSLALIIGSKSCFHFTCTCNLGCFHVLFRH